MWYKLWRTIVKEILLLSRDLGGLAVLFVMPLILVVMVTLIQNQAFESNTPKNFPLLWIDNDQDSIAQMIHQQLTATNTFDIISEIDNQKIQLEQAKQLVNEGKYQMAIVLPKNLSQDLYANVTHNVEEIVGDLSIDTTSVVENEIVKPQEIQLIFDPTVQENFRNSIKFGIEKMIYQAQTEVIYQTFQEYLGETSEPIFDQEQLISYKEIIPNQNNEIQPNAVQHNVPAWTLFAIFFIIVPLSINIVKEKNLGTNYRLLTSPMPFMTLILGKVLVYLMVCLLQFYAVLIVSKIVFPLIGLDVLAVNGKLIILTIMTIFVSLAAIGLGILLGTISKTQEQAPPFAATLVVILAAMGGVWIPVFMMSDVFQNIAELSPMRWGLSGYYDIILRNGGFSLILPEIILLFLFFILCLGIALLYDRKRRTI